MARHRPGRCRRLAAQPRRSEGWWLLGAGAACLIADVVIDFVWAHPAVSKSDQPNLNRPAAQLVGRVLIVAEAIEGGRGKVRVGDTLWPVEGPDAPAGAEVRVTAAKPCIRIAANSGSRKPRASGMTIARERNNCLEARRLAW